MLLLFIPLLLGMKQLYPWMRPEVVAGDRDFANRSNFI